MYQGKKVLILGFGISGKAAAQFLKKRGAAVSAVDKTPQTCEGIEVLTDTVQLDMSSFDFAVVSPGFPPAHPLFQKALQAGLEMIGEVELACRNLHQTMIGITGTNGKTTVTLLVEHVLNASGKPAKALGNVGLPLTAEIDHLAKNDIIVLELSSFQLETMHSKVLDCGVILNITPDHLDRYDSMQDYAAAKLKLKDCLKPQGICFMDESAARDFGACSCKTYGYSPSNDLYTDLTWIYKKQKPLIKLPPLLAGQKTHDVENALAALALCMHLEVSPEAFFSAYATFKKPAHRIEFVKEHQGIHFYDDSKGTNLDAVIRAVQTMKGSVILIAGGVDKGAPYTPWIESFQGKVKGICVIGQAAQKIQEQLSAAFPVYPCQNLEDAVRKAYSLAFSGDNVLLSPGCSSYDMFKSYAHRGEEFQRIVNQLSLSGELR